MSEVTVSFVTENPARPKELEVSSYLNTAYPEKNSEWLLKCGVPHTFRVPAGAGVIVDLYTKFDSHTGISSDGEFHDTGGAYDIELNAILPP
jgi:hypothetical protein